MKMNNRKKIFVLVLSIGMIAPVPARAWPSWHTPAVIQRVCGFISRAASACIPNFVRHRAAKLTVLTAATAGCLFYLSKKITAHFRSHRILQETVTELRGTNAWLFHENQDLQNTRELLERQGGENAALQAQLATARTVAENTPQRLGELLETWGRENTTLKAELAEARTAAEGPQQLRTENATLREQIKQHNEALHRERQQRDSLLAEQREEQAAATKNLHEQVAALTRREEEAKHECETTRQAHKILQAELQKLRASQQHQDAEIVARVRAEIERDAREKAEREVREETLQSIKGLEKSHEVSLASVKQRFEDQTLQLRLAIEEKKGEIAELRAELARHEEQHNPQETAALLQQIAQLQAANRELRRQCDLVQQGGLTQALATTRPGHADAV
jgi:FtsZ-binding cell division protein ZapB